MLEGRMVSVSLVSSSSSSSSEFISGLEDSSTSSSSIIGDRRCGWGNGVTGITTAPSPSPWFSPERRSGPVFLKVILLTCMKECKDAVSKARNWLDESVGLGGDCRVSSAVSSSKSSSQIESEKSDNANGLTELESKQSP